MTDQTDVERIALSLPGASRAKGRQWGFAVANKPKPKGFVWVWMERISPKQARVPCPAVIAIRTASLSDKDMLLASDANKFFTEPHYDGYCAVLVRLAAIDAAELEVLLTSAWRCQAPPALIAELDARPPKRKRAPKRPVKRAPKRPIHRSAKRSAK